MSSKRKCIVILLFIVIVSILFILYNRSQFFFGMSYHCTYSVYQLHSKSFQNHKSIFILTIDFKKSVNYKDYKKKILNRVIDGVNFGFYCGGSFDVD